MQTGVGDKSTINVLDDYIEKLRTSNEIEETTESPRRARSRQNMAKVKKGWEKTTKFIDEKRGSTGMPLISL